MSLWQSLTWYLLYLCCRFHEHWRFVLQRLVFLAAFVVYLETETLVTREAVTEILGSKCLRVICRVLYISLGFGVGGTIFSVCECVRACVCVRPITAVHYLCVCTERARVEVRGQLGCWFPFCPVSQFLVRLGGHHEPHAVVSVELVRVGTP